MLKTLPTPRAKDLTTVIPAAAYERLKTKIGKVFIQAQQAVERQKVLSYWDTGKIINDDIKLYGGRAEHGKSVIEKLGEDLGVNAKTLYKASQFAAAFPILAARRELTWAHYRVLITVSNEKKRLELMERAEKQGWTSRELEVRVFALNRALADGKAEEALPLEPRRGIPYTYKVLEPASVMKSEADPVLDLGFKVSRTGGLLKGFKQGDIVESVWQGGEYKLIRSKRGEEALYTYRAWVERVIDGDTLQVSIDLGFDTIIREKLRLRGLDCPEMDTREGVQAAAFVRSVITSPAKRGEAIPGEVIIRTTRSDKYDRYLADVFISKGKDEFAFLNNHLLESDHAVRI